MTPGQIRLLRNSYPKIEPNADQIGAIFYQKLFEMAPQTRALFGEDMTAQRAKFMSVVKELVSLHLRSLISLPVTMLENSETALPALHALGKRHVAFGVVPAHFDLMRKALLDTFGEVLGSDFTPDLREAWEAAFDLMANVMKSGLKDGAPPAPQFLERLPEEDVAEEAPIQDFLTAAPEAVEAVSASEARSASAPETRTGFFDRLFRRP
jgi:nitric oxide dioxygenase